MQDRFKFRYVFKKDFGGKIGIRYKMPVFNLDDAARSVFENKIIEYTNFDYKLISIEQCTGLKDRNGKPIYEGDIVRLFCDEFENIHTVKFGDFAMYSLDFQTEYEKGSTAVYGYYLGGLKYPIPLSISLDTSGMQIEVIGNKFQNPELLNEVENDT